MTKHVRSWPPSDKWAFALATSIWKWAVVGLLLAGVAAYADTPPSWSQAGTFAGAGDDVAYAVKIDASGNRYLAGYFNATATFNGTTLVSHGGSDIFLAKYGSSGNLLWLVQSGGSGLDTAYDIAFDTTGSVYMTGLFTDSATFGSVDGKTQTVTGVNWTLFLAKYSATGNLLWVRVGEQTACSSCLAFGNGLAVDSITGSVYVTGLSQATTTLTSADGQTYQVSGPGTWHMILVKYDTAGQFHWGVYNSASPNSIPSKIAVDASDNAYVTGWFEGNASFTSQDGKGQTINGLSRPVQSYPDYPNDTFVVKYDGGGNLKWINDIGGYKAIGQDIAVSPSGTISVGGFIGNINGSASQSKTIVTSQSPGSSINLGGGQFTNPYNRDGFIATYDSSGVALSAVRIGAAGQDSGTGITYDAEGNLYLSGVFEETVNVGGKTLNGTQTNNVFVLKYASGSVAWAKAADGAGTQDFGNDPRLSVGPDGGVFVAGGYQGTATFDGITLHSAGANDIFLMELGNLAAGLSLRSIPYPTPTVTGGLLTYAFKVWNQSSEKAVHEILTTQVPAGTTFNSIDLSGTAGLGSCTTPSVGAPGAVMCKENSVMRPGSTWTIRLTVNVTASKGTVISVSATASSDNLGGSTATAHNTVH